jgi:hypothetical protein
MTNTVFLLHIHKQYLPQCCASGQFQSHDQDEQITTVLSPQDPEAKMESCSWAAGPKTEEKNQLERYLMSGKPGPRLRFGRSSTRRKTMREDRNSARGPKPAHETKIHRRGTKPRPRNRICEQENQLAAAGNGTKISAANGDLTNTRKKITARGLKNKWLNQQRTRTSQTGKWSKYPLEFHTDLQIKNLDFIVLPLSFDY